MDSESKNAFLEWLRKEHDPANLKMSELENDNDNIDEGLEEWHYLAGVRDAFAAVMAKAEAL